MRALYEFTDLVWGAKEYSGALQHVREGPFKFIPVRDDEKQVQKGFITRLLTEPCIEGRSILTPDHLRHLLLGSMYCYAEVHNHYRRRNDPRDSAALQENKKFATVLR